MNRSMQQRSLELSARFERAWAGLEAKTDPEPVLAALVVAYQQPHRHYHTLEHIEACLAWLDWHWSLAEHPHEIAMAIWFHDAVYDPLASDNEARSAASATSALSEAKIASNSIRRIEAMVLATRDHVARTKDEALMLSIDLAILGASPAAYARFERDVRREYEAFDDAAYAKGRIHALTALASHVPLYPNPVLAAELEKKARRNIDQACAKLKV